MNSSKTNALEIKNLSKKFEKTTALQPVSFNLLTGQTIGVIGLSGCGKTTLLRCIAGLVKPYSGTILISGERHQQYLNKHRIAMIFQRYSNFEWLSVLDNLKEAFVSSPSAQGIEDQCLNMLNDLGLYTWKDNHISELSGGMQQRIALGRALLQDQDLIGLDEPFAALDVKNRRSMQELVKAQMQLKKRSAVFVTHDIEEAIYVSDSILLLSNSPNSEAKIFSSPYGSVLDQSVKNSDEFRKLQSQITEFIVDTGN